MTTVERLPNPLLVEYTNVEKDTAHQFGDACLRPIRWFVGQTATVSKEGRAKMQETASRAKRVGFCLLAIPAALLGLVGALILSFSETHKVTHLTALAQEHLDHKEYEKGLKLFENAPQNVMSNATALQTRYQLALQSESKKADGYFAALAAQSPHHPLVAVRAYQNGDYAAAKEGFARLLDVAKQEHLCMIAATHVQLEEYAEAVALFDQKDSIPNEYHEVAYRAYKQAFDRDNSDHLKRLAFLAHSTSAKDCMSLSKEVIKEDPNDPLANLQFGLKAFEAENFEEAAKHLKKTDDNEYYGYALGFLGEDENAIKVLQNVPGAEGAVLYLKGNYQEALDAFSKLEEMNLFLKWCEGNAYLQLGRFKKAVEAFSQSPNLNMYKIGLATAKFGLNELDAALKVFEEIPKEYFWVSDYATLAKCYQQTGDQKKALEILALGLVEYVEDEELLELQEAFQPAAAQ